MSKPQTTDYALPTGPTTGLPTVALPNSALTPMDMLDRAVAGGASIETLERLMALNERYQAQQAKAAFDEAMAAAKAEIPVIFKNKAVDFTSAKGRTNYRHEDLAGIARTVDPILTKHGLSYRFRTSSLPNDPVSVTCIVSHRAGHSEENTLTAGRDDTGNKNSIQQIGSTITYLQRYTLKAALGLSASTDDDGRASSTATGPISEAQAEQITALIQETKSSIDGFLKWAGAESVSDIPASKFNDAITMLNTKKAKMGAK